MDEWEPINQNILLVMGLTGAGKTFFINRLSGQNLEEGSNLISCTAECQIVETNIGETEFVIVDCPGFDDTNRSDAEILKEIAEQLSAVRRLGYNLKGIIYLHQITSNKMKGTDVKNLDLFAKLVGEEALSHVVLATTMWAKVTNMEEANRRDSELREVFWGDMMRKGAMTMRFDGSMESAQGIVSQLLGKKPVVLKVQEQLVDQEMSLKETAAGSFLEPMVDDEAEEFRQQLEKLQSQLQYERDANRRLVAKRGVNRNSAGLQQRIKDQEALKSKPGVVVESKFSKWKKKGLGGVGSPGVKALQALAAICNISLGIASFVLGGGY